MIKKIKEASESIKSKLSFEDYKPSTHNTIQTEEHNDVQTYGHNDIKTEEQLAIKTEKPRKVKRTFYILESIVKQMDAMYATRLVREDKIDKSDIVAEALLEFMKNENADVRSF